MGMTRSLTGHRIGECHQRSKEPDSKVVEARRLRQAGKTYTEIGSIVGVNWRTVSDWVNYVTRYDAR